MSYLKFDKNLLINLEKSLSLELLRTNKSGAYHATTLIGCNTRKYHGLLVMPVPSLDDMNHVMLSSLDETVIQRGAAFNLGIHKYSGDNFSPKGHKYIREFDCDSIPRCVYRVGGVLLSKEKVFISHENRILIRYTLLEAHSPTTLHLRPFLAFRSVNHLMRENDVVNTEYKEVENGIRSCLYDGYPGLYMQVNKEGVFLDKADWYRGVEYIKEQERGYDYKEDLYVPGVFEVNIQKGEQIIFTAGTSQISTKSLKGLFEKELQLRTSRNSFYNCLRNSAEQFVNKINRGNYLIAGYPWFHVRARDTFIALPGTTLAIGDEVQYHAVMETALQAYSVYMDRGRVSATIKEMDAPDVLLWAMWAISQYAKFASIEQCKDLYLRSMLKIIDYILQNKHSNLFPHYNGLLYAHGANKAVSWMNVVEGGCPVVPRTGYLVEFNALWYHALSFCVEMLKLEEDEYASRIAKYETILTDLHTSFNSTFVNEHGYLYDYVVNGKGDLSVRPNMLWAVALDYTPLDRKVQKQVLDISTRELLTPKGLRSLSPKSLGYNPYYVGNQSERNYAYHQGVVHPWMMGAFAEAYLKIFKRSGVSFLERKLIGFEDEMAHHCVATLSEVYDGNPPFTGRGAISTAMNVGEILRVLYLLDTFNSEQ